MANKLALALAGLSGVLAGVHEQKQKKLEEQKAKTDTKLKEEQIRHLGIQAALDQFKLSQSQEQAKQRTGLGGTPEEQALMSGAVSPQVYEQRFGTSKASPGDIVYPKNYTGAPLLTVPPKPEKITPSDIIAKAALNPNDLEAQRRATAVKGFQQTLVPPAFNQQRDLAGVRGTAAAFGTERVRAAGRMAKLAPSIIAVNSLELLANEVFTTKGYPGVQGVTIKGRRLVGDPLVKKWDDQAGAFVGQLRAIVANEPGGVLSNFDIDRIQRSLPNDWSNTEDVRYKFQLVRSLMAAAMEGELAFVESGSFIEARRRIDDLLAKLEQQTGPTGQNQPNKRFTPVD